MHATTTMKRFVFNRAGGFAAALIIVTSGIIGVTVLAVDDETSHVSTVDVARVMPNAFVSAGQGEGLIDAANSRIAAKTPLNAFVWDGQGEGLIDGANARVEADAAVRSFVWDGKVEGLIDGADRATVQAYLGFGQGEGLVGPGGSADQSLIEPQRQPLEAHPSPGQGEGLVDPANRSTGSDVLTAYPDPDREKNSSSPED